MPKFHVAVKISLASSLLDLDQDLHSQNAAHAAACGLSLAGTGYADVIEVRALQPVPGRPVATIFRGCSQGIYGFCYASRSQSEFTESEVMP